MTLTSDLIVMFLTSHRVEMALHHDFTIGVGPANEASAGQSFTERIPRQS
jgi:hypothetical protein